MHYTISNKAQTLFAVRGCRILAPWAWGIPFTAKTRAEAVRYVADVNKSRRAVGKKPMRLVIHSHK